MPTFYKGKIAKEDVKFGVSTFLRYTSDLSTAEKTEINKEHIPRKITVKTADYAIQTDVTSGEFTFTNAGAAETVKFTLPVAKAGMGPYFFFVAEDGQEIQVDPNGTEYFRDCAAGKYKASSVAGNILKVFCNINGIWEYDYEVVSGVWDNET